MSDEAQGESPRIEIMDGAGLLTLLDAAHRIGSAGGLSTAYRDIVGSLKKELDDAETELLRTPDNAVILGTIIVLGKLVKRFEPAPRHYAQQCNEGTERLARICRGIGLIGEEHEKQFTEYFGAPDDARRMKG